MSSTTPPRRLNRLLVVNRGEIALRILHAAQELPIPLTPETFALYTSNDSSYCSLGQPDHAIQIPSPASYTDIPFLVHLARQHKIDAVHPGYGFLSESAEFARRMWDEAGAVVIGPGWEILAQTGDKLQAKKLAERCGVPILKAMERPTASIDEIRAFAVQVKYPVMIKAVDGGGGRGIRLVHHERGLSDAVNRALGESPSRSVFVEKAAVGGFHHIEIQVVGDGKGQVRHLWERDCSAQRRFQKVVEYAPALVRDRTLIQKVISAALKMAREIQYLSLGTFEFLVNEQTSEFYFLEINPRLQVEHTVTESITDVDLVQTQLLLASGYPLQELALGKKRPDIEEDLPPSTKFSIQLRLCSEDPHANFALSIGKIAEFTMPRGNGVRVDSHVTPSMIVGADFDNLLAKIIVTANSWDAAFRKAQRALANTRVAGVATNIDLLRGIVSHKDFLDGKVDTQWLEANTQTLLTTGRNITDHTQNNSFTSSLQPSQEISSAAPASALLFRKGDAWSITLEPIEESKSRQQTKPASPQPTIIPHHLLLSRVLRNDFPSSLSAEIEYTTPDSKTPVPYHLQLAATTTSASALTSSSHCRGDPSNPHHIILPLSGKLIEVLVTEGEDIAENQVVAFVKQMKMELEVRSPRAGRAKWVFEMDEDGEDEGEDVAEGMLLVELEDVTGDVRKVELKGKL